MEETSRDGGRGRESDTSGQVKVSRGSLLVGHVGVYTLPTVYLLSHGRIACDKFFLA